LASVGNYNLRGRLKPLNCFLDSGWEAQKCSIYKPDSLFELTYEELDSELYLKEITDYVCNLELEDENGTQYMRDWFSYLQLIN
jgi:hypothetical protein